MRFGIFLIILAAVLTLTAWSLKSPGVWITDNGNKLMLLENLSEYGDIAMVNPSGLLDLGDEFFPDAMFHFQKLDGKFYSIFPEYFSVLNLPLYEFFGFRLWFVLPLAGTLITLWYFYRLSPMSGPTAVKAALILLAATPLLFYSLVFWEMTPAVAVAMVAIYLLVKRRKYFLSGLILGAGLYLREEMYFLAFAAGVALLTANRERWRAATRFGIGFLLAAISIWLRQLFVYGHVLGLHGALYYTHNAGDEAVTPVIRLWRLVEGYYVYLFRFTGNFYWHPGTFLLLVIPLMALLFVKIKRRQPVLYTAMGAYLILTVSLLLNPDKMLASGLMVGVVSSLPVFALFWGYWPELLRDRRQSVRFLTVLALVYVVILPPFLTLSDIGVIWGARHFLFVMPILLLLSLRYAALARSRRVWALFYVGAILGVLIQFCGLAALKKANDTSAQMTAFLRQNSSRVIVSDLFFVPEMTPEIFSQKCWLFVKDASQVDAVIRLLQDNHVEDFSLVTSTGRFRCLDDDGLKKLLALAVETAPIRIFKAPAGNFLDFALVPVKTGRK